MIKEICFNDFCNEFESSGRKAGYTYNGLRALFDHMEESEPNYSLDVVELDSEWAEYETAARAVEDIYTSEDIADDDEDDDEVEESALDFLRARHDVICFDSGILVRG